MSANGSDSCPKCGRPRAAGSSECLSCGVVYARFHAIVKPPQPLAARQTIGQAPQAQVPLQASAAQAPVARAARLHAATAHGGPVYTSMRQKESLLRLLGHAIQSGLTAPAFAHSGGAVGLPAEVAYRLQTDSDRGIPLSQTLLDLGLIDAPAAGMLRAKEAHGSVPEGLTALADRVEGRRRVKNRLLGMLAYPYGVLLVASLVAPLPLAFSHSLAAYLGAALPAFLGVLAVPVGLLGVLPRVDPRGKSKSLATRLASHLPLCGGAALNGALASFADVLGASLAAGLPVRQALPMAAEAASSHPAFDGAGDKLVAQLDAGATLAAALGSLGIFPALFLAQVGSGEASGTLDASLKYLHKEHEERARAGWMTTAIVAGVVFALGTAGILGVEIISGFKASLSGMDSQIDAATRP